MIREDTSSAQVLGFLNALESFRGEPWTIAHVSLMKRSFEGRQRATWSMSASRSGLSEPSPVRARG